MIIQVLWPGYDAASYGDMLPPDYDGGFVHPYVTLDNFDPLPVDPEAWFSVEGNWNVGRYRGISAVWLKQGI